MIDFRYHLVSIASVFLALAVGIVLGAGPLRGPISDTLTSEVTKLREDANALRADLTAAESAVEERTEIITALRPRALSGVLETEPVSILVLPGAGGGAVDDAQAVLAQAAAPTATVARLDASWSRDDDADEEARANAAAEVRDLIEADLPADAAPTAVLEAALRAALVTPSGSDSAPLPGENPTADPGTQDQVQGGLDDSVDTETAAAVEHSQKILAVLASHELVTDDSDVSGVGATSVVVIAPDNVEDGGPAIASWTSLITGIDVDGTVTVAGDVPDDATVETSLIAAIRGDEALAQAVATLDNLTTPVGLAALPLVVAEVADGAANHYGATDAASALFPPVPPVTP